MNEVIIQNLWNFNLGSQENMKVPICIFKGFQQRNRQDSQNLNNDTYCRLPVILLKLVVEMKGTLMLVYFQIIMMMIIARASIILKKLLNSSEKRTSFNHIYQIMFLNLQLLGLVMLVILCTFQI